jgi:hypothetical protein
MNNTKRRVKKVSQVEFISSKKSFNRLTDFWMLFDI